MEDDTYHRKSQLGRWVQGIMIHEVQILNNPIHEHFLGVAEIDSFKSSDNQIFT